MEVPVHLESSVLEHSKKCYCKHLWDSSSRPGTFTLWLSKAESSKPCHKFLSHNGLPSSTGSFLWLLKGNNIGNVGNYRTAYNTLQQKMFSD